MYEIAFVHVSHRDAAAARVMFERVIGTRHPVWAAAAMAGLAGVLRRRDDPEGAEALYREGRRATRAGLRTRRASWGTCWRVRETSPGLRLPGSASSTRTTLSWPGRRSPAW